MTKISLPGLLIFIISLTSGGLYSQNKVIKSKAFQFSLAPGIGTNGLQPGSFSNGVSINVTSGYSDANQALEIAGISNLNQSWTRGLQLAGLFNVTGGNAFSGLKPKEIETKTKQGFEATLVGLQISGLGNVVINNVHGGQISGGINLARGALSGVQFSGLSNTVLKFSFGAQIAGGWNVSKQSMNGTMVSGLFNYVDGELQGVQISAVNHAGIIEGVNSFQSQNATGLQIGLVNTSASMDGFQIGLVNFAKHMQGTQIGIINIYRGGEQPNTKDGTSIGLVNIGDLGYIAVSADELFGLNYELATGNSKNGRETQRSQSRYVVGSLLYSRMAYDGNKWGAGYGLKKMIFNVSTQPGMSEYRFFAYELDVMHINQEKSHWTKDISMLSRLKLTAGTKLHPKLHNIYVFGGLTMNAYYSGAGYTIAPALMRSESITESHVQQFWPGAILGVLIH